MSFTLQPPRLPEDYARIAELLNFVWTEPTSAERLEEDDGKLYKVGKTSLDENGRLIGYDRERVAAVHESGRIVGYGWTWRAPWTDPGELHNTWVVDPEWRGKGVGSALLEHAEAWARRLGADRMLSVVHDNDADSLRFAEKRGYVIERHTYQSRLDTADFDNAIIPGAVDSVRDSGIRFLTLADDPGEAGERKLYELYRTTAPDIPGHPAGFPDFTEWKKWSLNVSGHRPELCLLAADGDRYVGVAHLIRNDQTGGLYHEYTGVDREYRGKGIALALKVLCIEKAKRLGVPYVSTHNDSANAPMLAVNRKMNYRRLPGSYRVVKNL